MATVYVYTDGACSGNPGPGGWGALLCNGSNEKKLCGGEKYTTNNRMELIAPIEALKALRFSCKVELYTDSTYVKNGIQHWIKTWKMNNWKTSTKQSVKNRDLWEMLDQEVSRHTINWHWVKGHSGDYGNEMADTLARKGMNKK